jgi:hypothetical protein
MNRNRRSRLANWIPSAAHITAPIAEHEATKNPRRPWSPAALGLPTSSNVARRPASARPRQPTRPALDRHRDPRHHHPHRHRARQGSARPLTKHLAGPGRGDLRRAAPHPTTRTTPVRKAGADRQARLVRRSHPGPPPTLTAKRTEVSRHAPRTAKTTAQPPKQRCSFQLPCFVDVHHGGHPLPPSPQRLPRQPARTAALADANPKSYG